MKKTIFLIQLAVLITLPGFSQSQSVIEYSKFRAAIGGGYARQVGKREKQSDPKLEKLSKDLINGFVVDFDTQYFFNLFWGLGLNANYVQGSASATNITMPDLGTLSTYKEKPTYFYIGPSYVARTVLSKFQLVTNIGVGPIFFSDTMIANGVSITGKQTTFGLNAGIGGEYKSSKNIGIGLKLSYTTGNINSLNVKGQKVDLPEKQSVSNLMITAFLSFNK